MTFYGALTVVTSLIIGGFGWSWKTSRNWGILSQKVRDLADTVEEVRREEVKTIQKLSDNVSSMNVAVATLQTDITWIKETLKKNGRV